MQISEFVIARALHRIALIMICSWVKFLKKLAIWGQFIFIRGVIADRFLHLLIIMNTWMDFILNW
jgi:hypothetical protein